MNKRVFALLAALCIALCCLAGCGNTEPNPTETTGNNAVVESVDYAGTVELDMSSATLKQEVTVKAYIDGDTTHFFVPSSVSNTGLSYG